MKKMFTTRSGLVLALAGVSLLGATVPAVAQASAASSVTNITVWGSGGDQSQEQNAITYAVNLYNKEYKGKYHATLSFVPNISTVEETINAAGTGTVMEGDGPTLPYLAYSGKLSPINGYVSAANVANQSSYVRAQNSYNGKLYGMSTINGTLDLYGNKALLADAGITSCGNGPTTATCYPTSWANAWTSSQFTQVLTALHNNSTIAGLDSGYVWSANLAYGGEYSTYGFLPIINSAGSPVIKNNSANSLKTSAVYSAIQQFLGWLPWCDPTSGSATSGGTGGAFANGDLPLHWGGHWQYPGFSTGAVTNGGKDMGNLVSIPLPNFGAGAKDGAGSNDWTVGASASKAQLKAAGAFLDIVSTPSYIDFYTAGNGQTVTSGGTTVPKYGDGAVPASPAALAKNPEYSKGGILYEAGVAETKACPAGVINASCFAVPRPVTPAYPAITSAISTMFNSLFASAETGSVSLDTIKSQVAQAVDAINSNYQQYNNYK
jgi:multiple sugar transport system substrate-binding protein